MEEVQKQETKMEVNREGWYKRANHLVFRRGGLHMMHGFFRSLSTVGRLHPSAKPARHGVERLKNIPYKEGSTTKCKLDIYRPLAQDGPSPVVFYIHGGAFQILSKDTHWGMALAFARQGYTVCNVNYRLAPKHRYPDGISDLVEALEWVMENIGEYGGDAERIILAGESAGANLAASLAVAACYEVDEPWAKKVWDLNPSISALLPACGILEVSGTSRFRAKGKIPTWLVERIEGIEESYLPLEGRKVGTLADPLTFIEQGKKPTREFPPTFVFAGTRDPLLDDTRRMHAALNTLGVPCQIEYYPGGVHAFHAFVWTKLARKCWKDTYAFLDEYVPLGTVLPK